MTTECEETTPNHLAGELGISPKTLRGWLRKNGMRPEAENGARWLLTREQCVAARRRWSPDTVLSTSADDALEQLADWSGWESFADAAAGAPRVPGVYLLRLPDSSQVVYVGMAGKRRGQGLRGRLAMYRRGKAATSGFGEAVLDRALADARFLEHQLMNLTSEGPRRTAQWAKDAIAWFHPEVCWATSSSAQEARELEADVERLLRAQGLWNRPRNLD